jgi:hypothetical protein
VDWYKGAKDGLPEEAQEIISKTISRKRMQDRYIQQVRTVRVMYIYIMCVLNACNCFFNVYHPPLSI